MNELIKITTDSQGELVVSARELYSFLGLDGSQWARWSKKNIINNPFAKEGEDWQGLDMMSSSNNGSKTRDFALTLDFAKRLSMLARTDKGEEIRRYFIDKEKQLRQLTQPSTDQLVIQLVSQQAQLLAGQQELLSQLRADLDQLITTQNRPVRPSPTKSIKLPAPGLRRLGIGSLRQLINQKVNEYCEYHGAQQSETYNYLYKRLHDVYGVNVYRLLRGAGESLLDALERYGHLDRLYSLIMAELTYTED